MEGQLPGNLRQVRSHLFWALAAAIDEHDRAANTRANSKRSAFGTSIDSSVCFFAFPPTVLSLILLLTDDMVAQMIKSSGGYLMALKNYDGYVSRSSRLHPLLIAIPAMSSLISLRKVRRWQRDVDQRS